MERDTCVGTAVTDAATGQCAHLGGEGGQVWRGLQPQVQRVWRVCRAMPAPGYTTRWMGTACPNLHDPKSTALTPNDIVG